jgi:acetyltransferase-like isoleucine patch superfamily enzyme
MGKRLRRYVRGFKNRVLAHLARFMPGAYTFRVWCHRMRGIRMGTNVWLGYDLILETEYPERIWIGDNVEINMRATLIAHFHGIRVQPKGPGLEKISIKLEDDVFIGPGVIILPNVVVGRGAAVAAGSVVTRNVPPMTLVQGNPAVPVAALGIPLAGPGDYMEFLKKMKPYRPGSAK